MRSKGFTLVELVIVIVIVGVLSVVAVPVYKGYTKKAMATEGKTLLGSINTAQKVYFSEFNNFVNSTQSSVLGITPGTNKYFTTFSLTGNTTAFTAVARGAGSAAGITLTLRATSTAGPFITERGL